MSEEHLIWFNVFRGAAGNAALFEIRARMVAECVPALAPHARGDDIGGLKAQLLERLVPNDLQKNHLEAAFALHQTLVRPDFGSLSLVEWLKQTVASEATQQSGQIFTDGIKTLDELLKSQSH